MAKPNKSPKPQAKPAAVAASPKAPRWISVENGGAESATWEHTVIWRDTRVNVVGWFLYPLLILSGILYAIILYVRMNGLLAAPTLAVAVSVVILLAFVALIFAGMAALLNTSILCQRSGWLQVHTAPLALRRTRSQPVSEVRSLKIGEWSLWKWRYYYLDAQLTNGKRFKVLSGFYSREALEKVAVELRHNLHL
jgi:hypothetical protein